MRKELTFDLAVVGSGFAGSILARAARGRGLRVVLLDRASHPRFALGESSTPLAAASLERLADGNGLPDLRDLAAWGRWTRRRPELRRGLKRGFTFYHHPGGDAAFLPDAEHRQLVAASPTDAVADAHWLREDVDLFLARQARAEGADVREGVELAAIEPHGDGFELTLRTGDGTQHLRARFLVDASGPAGAVARPLGARAVPLRLPDRGLVFAHLAGLPPFEGVVNAPPGPYPDEAAAVHHLMPGGWFYRLAFDHGVSSCGLLLRREAWDDGLDPARDPEAALHHQLERRAPALASQLADADPVVPWRWMPSVGHRLDRAAGDAWLALPHVVSFCDPLFSTGIVWSLRAVERALDVLESRRDPRTWGDLLAAEADRIESLVRLAWATMERPPLFRAVTLLYFAAVSFQESRERLLDAASPSAFAWEGFLGVGDPVVDGWFAGAEDRLAADPAGFPAWVREAIDPRDVAGLSTPGKEGLYGVDFEDLIRGADKLGLDPAEARRRVGRLRSAMS